MPDILLRVARAQRGNLMFPYLQCGAKKLLTGTRWNKTMIVFAPHPDDETFGCGGTIMKRIKEGYAVIIVVMTDGRNAFRDVLGIDNDPDPEKMKQIRMKEILRATKILGVPRERLCFLGYEDGALHDKQKDAEKKTAEILEKYYPTEVYLPYGKDASIDHRTTNQIVANCVRKICLPASLYQYSISQKYYPFCWFMSLLEILFRGNLVLVDISEFLSRKEAAIRQYQSQITKITERQKKPVIEPYHVKLFLRGKEVFFA